MAQYQAGILIDPQNGARVLAIRPATVAVAVQQSGGTAVLVPQPSYQSFTAAGASRLQQNTRPANTIVVRRTVPATSNSGAIQPVRIRPLPPNDQQRSQQPHAAAQSGIPMAACSYAQQQVRGDIVSVGFGADGQKLFLESSSGGVSLTSGAPSTSRVDSTSVQSSNTVHETGRRQEQRKHNLSEEEDQCPQGESSAAAHDYATAPGGVDIVLTNMVAKFSTECHIDLRSAAYKLAHCEYRTSSGCLRKRLRSPLAYANVFGKGVVIVTSSQGEAELLRAARRIARLLQRVNNSVRFCRYRITNVAATCRLPFEINVVQVAETYPKQAKYGQTDKIQFTYEPETFAGVEWRSEDPKATVRVFTTGSCTIVGAREVVHIETVMKILWPILLPFATGPACHDSKAAKARRRRAAAAAKPRAPKRRRRARASSEEEWEEEDDGWNANVVTKQEAEEDEMEGFVTDGSGTPERQQEVAVGPAGKAEEEDDYETMSEEEDEDDDFEDVE